MRRDVQVQDVAAALNIHPFMLSRWKREHREGKLTSAVTSLPVKTARQQSRIRRIEREMVGLKAELDFLKRAASCVGRNTCRHSEGWDAWLPVVDATMRPKCAGATLRT